MKSSLDKMGEEISRPNSKGDAEYAVKRALQESSKANSSRKKEDHEEAVRSLKYAYNKAREAGMKDMAEKLLQRIELHNKKASGEGDAGGIKKWAASRITGAVTAERTRDTPYPSREEFAKRVRALFGPQAEPGVISMSRVEVTDKNTGRRLGLMDRQGKLLERAEKK